MAWEGQRRTAARTAAERSAGGVASSTITVPSSSLWVKISGASAAHRPAPQHLLRSALTRKALTSPLQRQPVQPVHEHVGPELELVKRFGEAKAGKLGEQRGQRDAQLKPGEVLARALVYPVPERDMRLRPSAGAPTVEMTWVYRWNRGWSSAGTPSSSEMTSEGIGKANDATRSAGGPCRSIRSRCAATIDSMLPRSRATRLTVSSRMTGPRQRVCSGGSIPTSDLGSITRELRPSASEGGGLPVLSTLSRWSRSASRTSSCLVTNHAWTPFGQVKRLIPAERSASYAGGGSNGVARLIGRSGGFRSVVMAHGSLLIGHTASNLVVRSAGRRGGLPGFVPRVPQHQERRDRSRGAKRGQWRTEHFAELSIN